MIRIIIFLFFFFFQAEDGIRDVAVTGVQTCALPISRRGLELDGNSWYGQFELARALMGLNRVDTAQKIAEEARKRNPDYPQLHLLLANIHIRKHDYPALLEDLDSYLKLAPDSPTSDQARQRREEVQRTLANNRNVPAAEASKP